ncbi:MAG: MarR family transcriptional regulator [Ignavibacteria bacterium]|nr:MarR family transcriptional regulator [Ignavibacteria bacterium]
MNRLSVIFFNNLEHSIKLYRQFAQKSLVSDGIDITFDQWLVMQSLDENHGMNQREIAAMVSKDAASLTRILQLLVKKGYLEKKLHKDKRRSKLTITQAGKEVMKKAHQVIDQSRQHALGGVEEKRLKKLRKVLSKIIKNCS